MKHRVEPSIERLREAIDYDPQTGVMVWRVRPSSHFNAKAQSAELIAARINSRLSGKPALNSVDSKGYLFGGFDGRLLRQHRAAFAICFGCWPQDEVDHINGDRTDNRIANLRAASHRENGVNAKMGTHNTSGRIGVYWRTDRGRWQARIHSRGTTHALGTFANFDDAALARKEAEIEHGFHPNHGRAAT